MRDDDQIGWECLVHACSTTQPMVQSNPLITMHPPGWKPIVVLHEFIFNRMLAGNCAKRKCRLNRLCFPASLS